MYGEYMMAHATQIAWCPKMMGKTLLISAGSIFLPNNVKEFLKVSELD